MSTVDFPAILPRVLSGDEPIAETGMTLNDYWRWAHSNLVDNAERGAFAEYLVHTAMRASALTRVNWDRYDVKSPEGIAIEVKASGYIQSWAQEWLSTINFSIRPTFGWDSETNTYSQECSRQSDVYVFCLHAHKEQDTINPLLTEQWRFYIMSTDVLNKAVPKQKTISLAGVMKLGAIETDYPNLRNTIIAVAKR